MGKKKIEIVCGGIGITSKGYDFQVSINAVNFDGLPSSKIHISYGNGFSNHVLHFFPEDLIRIGFINPEALREYIEKDFNQ